MRILILPLALCAVFGLAACAVGPAAGESSGVASAATTSSPSASKPAAASTGSIDMCGNFPVSAIASATGRTVYTTSTERDGDSEGAKLYACQYTDSTDPSQALDSFSLAVYRGGNPDTIMTDLAAAQTSGATPVSGIGDRAQAGAGEIDVVIGSDVVVASDTLHDSSLSDLDPAVLRSLAQKVIAKV